MIKEKDWNAVMSDKMTAADLLEHYPVKTLVEDLVELARRVEPKSSVAVSAEDMQKIENFFKVKISKRGRKPKNN